MPPDYVLGLDLGQTTDFTALAAWMGEQTLPLVVDPPPEPHIIRIIV
jgi:hypothetical protein